MDTTNCIPCILFVLLLVAVQTYILKYVSTLEKIGCVCSDDYRRTYIKYYLVVVIVYGLAVAIFDAFRSPSAVVPAAFVNVWFAVSSVMWVASVVYLVLAWQYTKRLTVDKCECADGIELQVWRIFVIFQTSVLVASVILTFMIVTTVLTVGRLLHKSSGSAARYLMAG